MSSHGASGERESRPRKQPIVEYEGASGRVYGGAACCWLRPQHEPRKNIIEFVEWKPFDICVLLTIGANCLTMAWQSPLDPPHTAKSAFIDVCEVFFLGVFTTEMLCKMLAYGLLTHRNAYLKDAWCQLDFLVVSLAWLPILWPSMGNYSFLRAFRALRPLRALKRLPGMPMLVQWILDVMPKMGNVLMLCGFVFLVFGIVGMELFKGSLHYRCELPGVKEGTSVLADATLDIPCKPAASGGKDGQCPPGSTCAYVEEGPHTLISFDSVALALIILMQGGNSSSALISTSPQPSSPHLLSSRPSAPSLVPSSPRPLVRISPHSLTHYPQ